MRRRTLWTMWMGPLTGRCHCGGAGGAAACWHSSTGRGKCHASVLCRLCVRIGIQDDGLASDSRGHHYQRSRCQTFPQKLVGIRNKNTNAIMSAGLRLVSGAIKTKTGCSGVSHVIQTNPKAIWWTERRHDLINTFEELEARARISA